MEVKYLEGELLSRYKYFYGVAFAVENTGISTGGFSWSIHGFKFVSRAALHLYKYTE